MLQVVLYPWYSLSRPVFQNLNDLLVPLFLRRRHDASMNLPKCSPIIQQASDNIGTVVVNGIDQLAVQVRPFANKVLNQFQRLLLDGDGEIRQATKATDIGVGAILEHERRQVGVGAPAGEGKGRGLAFVSLGVEEGAIVGEESGPDRDVAVREGGVGDAGADLGVREHLKQVFHGRIVLLAHGRHEHLACPWRIRRLGLGACGIGDFGVGGPDVQALEEGVESGDVVGFAGMKDLLSTGQRRNARRNRLSFLIQGCRVWSLRRNRLSISNVFISFEKAWEIHDAIIIINHERKWISWFFFILHRDGIWAKKPNCAGRTRTSTEASRKKGEK